MSEFVIDTSLSSEIQSQAMSPFKADIMKELGIQQERFWYLQGFWDGGQRKVNTSSTITATIARLLAVEAKTSVASFQCFGFLLLSFSSSKVTFLS